MKKKATKRKSVVPTRNKKKAHLTDNKKEPHTKHQHMKLIQRSPSSALPDKTVNEKPQLSKKEQLLQHYKGIVDTFPKHKQENQDMEQALNHRIHFLTEHLALTNLKVNTQNERRKRSNGRPSTRTPTKRIRQGTKSATTLKPLSQSSPTELLSTPITISKKQKTPVNYEVHPHYLMHQSNDLPKLPWHNFEADDASGEAYFYEHLSMHLEKANRNDLLEESILNVHLLMEKLKTTPQVLLSDFSFIHEFYSRCHPMFKWIYGALQLSMKVLQQRPQELGSQLLGRMSMDDREHSQQEQFIADILAIQENKAWLYPFNRLTGLDMPRHCCPKIDNPMTKAPKGLFLEDIGGCCQVLVAFSEHEVILSDRFLGTVVASLSIHDIKHELNLACRLEFVTRSSSLTLEKVCPKHPKTYKDLSSAKIASVAVFDHFLLILLSNGCIHFSKLYIIENNLKFQLYPDIEERLQDIHAGATVNMSSKNVNTLFLIQQMNMLFPHLSHMYKLYDNILFINHKKAYYMESILDLYTSLRSKMMMKIEILLQTNSWQQGDGLDPAEFIPYFNIPAMEQPKGLKRPPRKIIQVTHVENTLAFATDDKFIITYAFQTTKQQEIVDTIRTSYDYDISMLCLNKEYIFSVETNRYYVDMWCRKQSIHLEYLMDRHSIESIEAKDEYLYTMVAEKIWVWSLERRQKVFRINLANAQVSRFVVDSGSSIITGSHKSFDLHDLMPCDAAKEDIPFDDIIALSSHDNFIFAITATHLKSIYYWTLDDGMYKKKIELPYLKINDQLEDGGIPSNVHLYDNYCIVSYYNDKVHCIVVYNIVPSQHNSDLILEYVATTDIECTQLSCIQFNDDYSELFYLAGHTVHHWHLQSNLNRTGFRTTNNESIVSIIWDKENHQLVTGDKNSRLRIWSSTSHQCQSEMAVNHYRLKPMRCMYMHEDVFIIVGDPSNALHMLSHTYVHFPLPLPFSGFSCIAVDTSESFIAFGFDTGVIEVFSITNQKSLCSYTADAGIKCMKWKFIDDAHVLIAGCQHGRLLCLQAQF